MKAIILAAGMGTRLGKYTEGLPKGMLEFAGKPLIEHQLDMLRSCGLNDIIIVKGYAPEKIAFPDVKYYVNEDFANTNMVETLMCAEKEMTEDFIVLYSDIAFEKRVLQAVLDAPCEIGVTVDTDFREYWETRLERPEGDDESFQIGPEGNIIELGSPNPSSEQMNGRYVGILKFVGKGIGDLKRVYHENREKYFESPEPWLNSKSFKKGYMTDMIQAIINDGVRVDPIEIKRGWLEFDTTEDYELYQKWLGDGTMEKFLRF